MFDIFITNPRCYRVMQQRPTDLTQWTKYKTVNRELTGDQFTAHLRGEKTLSASLVHQEQAQAMGLDIDAGGLDAGLRALTEAAQMGIHAIFIYEPGNVGGHDGGMLWAKLDAPVYWKRAWTLMDDLRDRAELTNAEAFPNPLPFRLPFGINLGCDPPTRGVLYTQDGQVIDLDSPDWHHQAAPIWNSLIHYPTEALPEAPEPVTPQLAIRRGDIRPLHDKDIIGLYNTHLEIDDLVELLERNSDYRRARWNYRTGGAMLHCGCGHHQHNDRTPSLELRPATTDIRRGWNLIGHSPHCQHHPTIGKADDPFNILLAQHGGNHRTAMREARQLVNAKRRKEKHPAKPHGGSGSNGETGDRACHNEAGETKNVPDTTTPALPVAYQPTTTAPLATLVKNDDAPAGPAPMHTPHPIEAYIQAHGTDSDYYLYRAYCDLGRDATNTQLNTHIAQQRLRPYSTGHLRRSKMKFWQLIREWKKRSTCDQNDRMKMYIDHDHATHESWTCHKQDSDSISATMGVGVSGGSTRSSIENHPPDGERSSSSLAQLVSAARTETLQFGNEVMTGTGEREAERCPQSAANPPPAAAVSIAQDGEARSDPTRPVCKTGYSGMEEGSDRAQSRRLPTQDSTGALPPANESPTAEIRSQIPAEAPMDTAGYASYTEPKRRPLPKDPKLRAMEQQRRRCTRYAAMSLDDLQETWAKLKGATRKARGRRQKALEHQVSSVEQIIARKRGQGMEAMLMVNPDAERGTTPVQLHDPVPAAGLHAPTTPPAPVPTPTQASAPQTPPQACVSQVRAEIVAAEDDGGVLRPVYRGLKRATPSIAHTRGVAGTPVPHRPVSQRRAATDLNDPWVQLQRSMLTKAEREGNTERAAWYRQVLANVGIDVPAASGELLDVAEGHVGATVAQDTGESLAGLTLGLAVGAAQPAQPRNLAAGKALPEVAAQPVDALVHNAHALTGLVDTVPQAVQTGQAPAPQVVVPIGRQAVDHGLQLRLRHVVEVGADRAFPSAFARTFPHVNGPGLPVHIGGLEPRQFLRAHRRGTIQVKHQQFFVPTTGIGGDMVPQALHGVITVPPTHAPGGFAAHCIGHEGAVIGNPAPLTAHIVELLKRSQHLVDGAAAETVAALLTAALLHTGETLLDGLRRDVFDILRTVFAGQGLQQTIDSPLVGPGRTVTKNPVVRRAILLGLMATGTLLKLEHAVDLMRETRTFRHTSLLSLMVRGPPWDDAGWVGEKPPASVSPPSPPLSPPTVV